MKTKLSDTLLRHISQNINCGQALWAMLTLNEYLEPTHHLHQAFKKRAQAKISEIPCELSLLEVSAKILNGEKLIDLTPSEREVALSFRPTDMRPFFNRRPVPQMTYQRRRVASMGLQREKNRSH